MQTCSGNVFSYGCSKISEPDIRQVSQLAEDCHLVAGTPVITGILDQLQGKAEPDTQSTLSRDHLIVMTKSEMPVKTGIFKPPNSQAFGHSR